MENKKQYHIGKGCVLRPCKAFKKPCRYGIPLSEHFNNVEEGQKVADKLIEQLEEAKGFGLAKYGNTVYPCEETELTIIRLSNIKRTIERLENIKKQARQDITKEMNDKGITALKDDIGNITFMKPQERSYLDTEKWKGLSISESETFKFVSTVEEYVKLESNYDENSKKDQNQKALLTKLTTPQGDALDFKLTEINGEVIFSQEAKNSFNKLKEFEDKLNRIDELKDKLRDDLMEQMKEKDIREIKVGKETLVYVPTHKRERVDSKAVRDYAERNNIKDILYKKVPINATVRIKYAS